MRKRVQHALQPKEGVNIDVDRVEEIVENYMKTNTENQDIEPLIQVGSVHIGLVASVFFLSHAITHRYSMIWYGMVWCGIV